MDGVTYLWDTNETTSFITVSAAREYIVTVTDVNGCTATASRTLTVNPLPIASITGDNEICAGENTIFTVNGGSSYLWSTTETNASITVNVASEYIVTVTDVNGCTATASRTLTVNPLPIASITGDNEICAGENTIFTANGGVTYLWDTNETSSFITVSVAREYIVTVTDVNGCTATASRTLTVNPLPIAASQEIMKFGESSSQWWIILSLEYNRNECVHNSKCSKRIHCYSYRCEWMYSDNKQNINSKSFT